MGVSSWIACQAGIEGRALTGLLAARACALPGGRSLALGAWPSGSQRRLGTSQRRMVHDVIDASALWLGERLAMQESSENPAWEEQQKKYQTKAKGSHSAEGRWRKDLGCVA